VDVDDVDIAARHGKQLVVLAAVFAERGVPVGDDFDVGIELLHARDESVDHLAVSGRSHRTAVAVVHVRFVAHEPVLYLKAFVPAVFHQAQRLLHALFHPVPTESRIDVDAQKRFGSRPAYERHVFVYVHKLLRRTIPGGVVLRIP